MAKLSILVVVVVVVVVVVLILLLLPTTTNCKQCVLKAFLKALTDEDLFKAVDSSRILKQIQ